MADIFTMKDGRKVTVDFASVKSVLAVKKKDWKEIRIKLQEALDFVNSPKYMENLKNSLCLTGANHEWSANGSCLTIYRW